VGTGAAPGCWPGWFGCSLRRRCGSVCQAAQGRRAGTRGSVDAGEGGGAALQAAWTEEGRPRAGRSQAVREEGPKMCDLPRWAASPQQGAASRPRLPLGTLRRLTAVQQ